MIIGKDRTNMPVTSSEQLDNALEELDENIGNKTTLYKHFTPFVDDHDGEYDVVVISGNDEQYLEGGETHPVAEFIDNLRHDNKIVSIYIIDQQSLGEYINYPVLEIVEGQSFEHDFYCIINGELDKFTLADQDQPVDLEDSVTQL